MTAEYALRRPIGTTSILYGQIEDAFAKLDSEQQTYIRHVLGLASVGTLAVFSVTEASKALDMIEAKLAEVT